MTRNFAGGVYDCRNKRSTQRNFPPKKMVYYNYFSSCFSSINLGLNRVIHDADGQSNSRMAQCPTSNPFKGMLDPILIYLNMSTLSYISCFYKLQIQLFFSLSWGGYFTWQSALWHFRFGVFILGNIHCLDNVCSF